MTPKRIILLLTLFLSVLYSLDIQAEKSIYIPKLSGTVRARYEYLTRQNLSAFKVRDFRVGIDGYVAPIMSYSGEVDFSDWGKIVLINAFINVSPIKDLSFNIGQTRMPFTIAAHRQPFQQYFVNRSFVAKNCGIRDVGLTGSYTIPRIPLTVQGSFFNCSGPNEHKIHFTNTYGFSAKLIGRPHPFWFLSASTARNTLGIARVQMWDIGGYFDNGLWHIEAEYLRKNYVHNLFNAVNLFDFFVYRNFSIEKSMIKGVSGAVRYDYMGNHSTGVPNDENKLIIDHPERHRLTLGATLSLKTKLMADIRLNYEKYFFKKGIVPGTADDDRIILELIAHF